MHARAGRHGGPLADETRGVSALPRSRLPLGGARGDLPRLGADAADVVPEQVLAVDDEEQVRGLREVPRDARRAGQGCRTVHARRVPGHVLSDGVHVRLYRCFNASGKARFVGSKKVPTVVWNVTVDYQGRPIFVSVAAPGSTNDKAIVQTHDMFMRRVLMKNDVYTGCEYKLARQNGVQKVRGVGVGVDGGYEGRRQFVAGYEHPQSARLRTFLKCF